MGRLIDESNVIEIAEKCTFTDESEKRRFLDFVRYCVKEAKTAYDVDKVVEELEEKIKDVEKIIVTPPQDKLDEIANDTAKDFIGAWKSAIKGVRKGGSSEG